MEEFEGVAEPSAAVFRGVSPPRRHGLWAGIMPFPALPLPAPFFLAALRGEHLASHTVAPFPHLVPSLLPYKHLRTAPPKSCGHILTWRFGCLPADGRSGFPAAERCRNEPLLNARKQK